MDYTDLYSFFLSLWKLISFTFHWLFIVLLGNSREASTVVKLQVVKCSFHSLKQKQWKSMDCLTILIKCTPRVNHIGTIHTGTHNYAHRAHLTNTHTYTIPYPQTYMQMHTQRIQAGTHMEIHTFMEANTDAYLHWYTHRSICNQVHIEKLIHRSIYKSIHTQRYRGSCTKTYLPACSL